MKTLTPLEAELLAALKRCLNHIEIVEGHKANDFECVPAARKAIASANKKTATR